MSWFWQNLITASLMAGLALMAWLLLKREYWRRAARAVFDKRTPRFCAVLLAAYILVALMDSVGWRRPLRNEATGDVMRSPENGAVLYDRGCSLLDRCIAPLRQRKEFSYSAPMASYGSTYVTKQLADGTVQRVLPELNYPKGHLLGTDCIGNDVLYLCLKSIRTGIIIGLLTTLIAVPAALIFGVMAGYFGGWVDDLIQYVYTVLNAIPTILFIAAFIVLFGAGLPQLCVAMGLASWTNLCRLLRAETMKIRESDYVMASRACGIPAWRIILRHVLPNVLHVVIITTVLRFSSEVLSEAVLTYLGVGVGADTMSWGTMINDARSELARTPIIWWKLASAFAFMIGLVLPANFFADAVRDALDPRNNG